MGSTINTLCAAPVEERGCSIYGRVRTMAARNSTLKDAAAITAGTASIAVLYLATPEASQPWRYLLQHLFYLPIIFGGLRQGWPVGLGAALLAALSFAPQLETFFGRAPDASPLRYWEIPIFCAAGVLSGLIAERERKQKRASEETARRLSKV
jgi:hypothetical protein